MSDLDNLLAAHRAELELVKHLCEQRVEAAILADRKRIVDLVLRFERNWSITWREQLIDAIENG